MNNLKIFCSRHLTKIKYYVIHLIMVFLIVFTFIYGNVIGGVSLLRGTYVGTLKLASMSTNNTFLSAASKTRNFFKRWVGPALWSSHERSKILPWATHVAEKGFDLARIGLGHTRKTWNSLMGLWPGLGALFND